MFGKKRSVLSKEAAVASNAALAALSFLQRGSFDIFPPESPFVWKDCEISIARQNVEDADGSIHHLASIRGHIGRRSKPESIAVSASIYVKCYRDGRDPVLATNVLHRVSDYRVSWSTVDRFKLQRTTDLVKGKWFNSDDEKRLDELPCPGIHPVLYGIRIRTLGHLKHWTRKMLEEATHDISIIAGVEEILHAFGYKLKAE